MNWLPIIEFQAQQKSSNHVSFTNSGKSKVGKTQRVAVGTAAGQSGERPLPWTSHFWGVLRRHESGNWRVPQGWQSQGGSKAWSHTLYAGDTGPIPSTTQLPAPLNITLVAFKHCVLWLRWPCIPMLKQASYHQARTPHSQACISKSSITGISLEQSLGDLSSQKRQLTCQICLGISQLWLWVNSSTEHLFTNKVFIRTQPYPSIYLLLMAASVLFQQRLDGPQSQTFLFYDPLQNVPALV